MNLTNQLAFRWLTTSWIVRMFKIFYVSCLVLPFALGVPVKEQENESSSDLDTQALFPDPAELARRVGYNAETHNVTTEDGYILQMHRITGRQKSTKPKPAVLILHGLLDCAATWVISDPTRSLAFSLSDRGYDVWLGNARGSRYSRKHKVMSTMNGNYWKFSWHEIGVYDVPAMIDHITETTKQEKIFYIGHSQGGTSFFVMASERPEYQKKIIASFTLAPAVFMPNTRNILFRLLSPIATDLKAVGDLIGLYEFLPSPTLMKILATKICQENAPLMPMCKSIIFLAGGIDKELNTTLVPNVVKYDPAGASVMQLVHYGQLINSGKFQQFNHGLLSNLWTYGQIHPPEYNLNNVNIPVHIHYSTNDALVDYKDSIKLAKVVPNAEKLLVPHKDFAHLDFVWGNNVDSLVYDKIYSQLKQYKS
ncbi:lipase 3-like [Osmia bicornis bicornis]|uniref:lipase 3-like n=1 Tax=Osmia bicornis bicornis TaxID=1437191 RepID=UPI001EAE86D5|nr:lipase 3-like [Osmia bicornis bicornis]